ncbi:MAG TPA: ABC transporter permease, partial [Atribacterota bacterium]|nr:ABC transporter permease [Atribacterota bacterium]
MALYILKRILSIMFSVIIVTIIIFSLMHSIPGGPFDEDKMPLSKAAKEKIMKMYGLDQPLYIQYLKYIWNALHFKFGRSYQSPGEEMIDLINRTFRVSAFLGGLGLFWAIPIGILLGIISAVKANSFIDYLFTLFSSYAISVPIYVTAIFMIFTFSLGLGWFPTGGFEGLKTWVMPIIAYGLYPSGIIIRYTRNSMLEVMNEPYILTAKSKGLPLKSIIVNHVFKNAMIPIITIILPIFARIITGSIFVETIFRIPGLGKYFVSSITQRDYPLMMTLMLLVTFLLGFTYLSIDILY